LRFQERGEGLDLAARVRIAIEPGIIIGMGLAVGAGDRRGRFNRGLRRLRGLGLDHLLQARLRPGRPGRGRLPGRNGVGHQGQRGRGEHG